MTTTKRKRPKKNNVTIREKPMKNGNASLFLDIYNEGIRTKEYLKLYIISKARSSADREANRQVWELAEKIKIDRESVLNHQRHGISSPINKKINLLDFFEAYYSSYTKKDIRMIRGAIDRFKDFLKQAYPIYQNHIKPDQLSKQMVKEFVDYLESKSIGEGARGYFQRFKKIISNAEENNFIINNPCKGVVCKVDDSVLKKDILSVDEMQLLIKTKYAGQNMEIRRAFIFSLYTGIRFCDLIELKYKHVDYSNKLLSFEQAKTKGKSSASGVTIPLNSGLLTIIGEKREREEFLFNLPTHTACLSSLRMWTKQAGIDKHITWHCARHSFAVNILNNGANIKTVASLLGHSGLKHTEKYTRAVDSLKENAINSLPIFEI